jgi:hypothetical protein
MGKQVQKCTVPKKSAATWEMKEGDLCRITVTEGSQVSSSVPGYINVAIHPNRLWGPPSLLSNWFWGLFPPGVKRPEREADHPPPTSAEVKKMWIYTTTPPYVFMA